MHVIRAAIDSVENPPTMLASFPDLLFDDFSFAWRQPTGSLSHASL